MKVYLYDTHSGLFEGEAFEAPGVQSNTEGITLLAPPEFDKGQVPVFDRSRNEWALISIATARQRLNGTLCEQES